MRHSFPLPALWTPFLAVALASAHGAEPPADRPDVIAAIELKGPVATLSASVPNPGQVTAMEYRIDGIPVARVPAPFTVALDTGRLLANGRHVLETVAVARTGPSGAAPPLAFSLANPYRQLLQDPGLEAPAAPGAWTGDVARVARAGAGAHGGNGCFAFQAQAGPLQVAQQATLPRGVAQAALRFWVRVKAGAAGAVPPGPAAPSRFQVLLRSVPPPGGTPQVLATLLTLTARDAWDDWLPYGADLTRLLDRKVELVLRLEPGSDGMEFQVDDVTLVCGRPLVEAAVTPIRMTLPAGGSARLDGRVSGNSDATLAWAVREPGGGTLAPLPTGDTSARIYRAPAAPGFYHVVATPRADPFGAAQVSIQVVPQPAPPRISPASIPIPNAGAWP